MAVTGIEKDQWLLGVDGLADQAAEIARQKLVHNVYHAGAVALMEHVGVTPLPSGRISSLHIARHLQSEPIKTSTDEKYVVGRVNYTLLAKRGSEEFYIRQLTGGPFDKSYEAADDMARLPDGRRAVHETWPCAEIFGGWLVKLALVEGFELPTYRFHHEVPRGHH